MGVRLQKREISGCFGRCGRAFIHVSPVLIPPLLDNIGYLGKRLRETRKD